MTKTSSPLSHLALTPPMGWNSFDCYGSSITEDEFRANVDYMAKYLRPFGWEYAVVDFCWSHPAPGAVSNPNLEAHFGHLWPDLHMDGYGRLLPAPARFPSAANGQGFKALADYVHSKGLKFGIHVMRGIPRQAVARCLPVQGGENTADGIADPNRTCDWLNHMYGVDMAKAGAQAYYDSFFRLYAAWGVDYVKVDDMVYPYHAREIEAVWQAASACGRAMVVSLSCGPALVDKAAHLQANSHLWRISADFWDDWHLLKNHFAICRAWADYSQPGAWADADMLPLGQLSLRGPKGTTRRTRFTRDEQITLMTLMAIMRSPLMFGGNLPDNDPFTLALITNPAVLAVNQRSANNRHLSTAEDHVVWCADVPDSPGKYVALFNLGEDATQPFTLNLSEIGLAGRCAVNNLWAQAHMGTTEHTLSVTIPPHGAGLYRISPEGQA